MFSMHAYSLFRFVLIKLRQKLYIAAYYTRAKPCVMFGCIQFTCFAFYRINAVLRDSLLVLYL